MPLPTPGEGESHDEFVSRCMGDATMVEEFDESDQRAAVCERQWSEGSSVGGSGVRAGLSARSRFYGQPWRMERRRLLGLVSQVLRPVQVDAASVRAVAAEAAEAAEAEPLYEVVAGVATIAIVGPMIKGRDPVYDWFGIQYTDTQRTSAAVAAAMRDPAVKSLLLWIDSGGGMTAGLDELTDWVTAAASAKPVVAHVSDWGASAAYEVAACATFISANEGAAVGSIGTCAVVWDDSERYAKAGVKAHLISSGGVKGQDVYGGVPVSEAYLAELQRLVDGLTEQFIGRVASGRGMSVESVRKLATGEMWLAAAAKERGLIDHVGSGDAAIARAVVLGARSEGRAVEESDMADAKTAADLLAEHPEASKALADRAAQEAQDAERESLKAMLEAFPGREAFAAQCAAEGLTAEQAKARLADVLLEENAAKDKEIAELAEQAAEADKAARGAITDGDDEDTDDGDDADEPTTYAEAKAVVEAELGTDATVSDVVRAVRDRWPTLCEGEPRAHKVRRPRG